jgi:hypothetical protein
MNYTVAYICTKWPVGTAKYAAKYIDMDMFKNLEQLHILTSICFLSQTYHKFQNVRVQLTSTMSAGLSFVAASSSCLRSEWDDDVEVCVR